MAPGPKIMRIRLQKGRHLVKRRDIWYLETCIQGLQDRHSLGTGDLQEATRRAAEGGEPGVLSLVLKPKPRPTSLTLAKAFEEYEDWYKKNRRENGSKQVLAVLRHFMEKLGEDFETRAITRDHIQRWVDGRVDGRAPNTVNRDYARLRAFIGLPGGKMRPTPTPAVGSTSPRTKGPFGRLPLRRKCGP
jgi:hypothetical protein